MKREKKGGGGGAEKNSIPGRFVAANRVTSFRGAKPSISVSNCDSTLSVAPPPPTQRLILNRTFFLRGPYLVGSVFLFAKSPCAHLPPKIAYEIL
jgi:hypothetical protein